MTSPTTLRGRLALLAVGATAVWVFSLTAIFNAALGAQLRTQADGLLRTRASAAASTVDVGTEGRVAVREPPNDAALDSNIWVFQGDRALERPKARPDVQRAARSLTGAGVGYADVGRRSPVRLYAEPILAAGTQIGTVVTATSLDPYKRTARTALLASVALAVLFLVGVYLVTRRIVAGALRPVSLMAEQAARWSAHDVDQRFGEEDRPTELKGLAASLDAVLDHISAVLRHEQQVAAELSHELRTPLSVIVAENDLLMAGSGADASNAPGHQTIADTAERMSHLLDTLLADATERVTESPGRCELAGAVRTAVAEVADGPEASAEIVVNVPAGLEVGVGAETLRRVLGPLLANARRHARGLVSVRGRRSHGRVEVVVEDDGPGVPRWFRDQVFEPGRRADPDDGHPGAGLGLALARRLARSAGGDITLGDPDEGAAFTVMLPGA